MGQQRHIVKRQVFELHIDSSDDASILQTEISRIYLQRIIPLIDRYCTQASSPDTIDRIELLELDIGVVAPNKLEQELVARVERQLKYRLAAQIGERHKQSRGLTSIAKRKTESQLELFLLFARTGTLPWWADSKQRNLLIQCLEYLLENESERLSQLIRTLVYEELPLKRLIRTYTDEHLGTVLLVLMASKDQQFVKLSLELIVVLSKSKLLTGFHQTRIRKAVWVGLLQEASLNRKHDVKVSEFFKQSLVRVACELGVTHTRLLVEVDFFRNADIGWVSEPQVRKEDLLDTISSGQDIHEIIDLLTSLETNKVTSDVLVSLIESLPNIFSRPNLSTSLLQRILVVLQQQAAIRTDLRESVAPLIEQLRSALQESAETNLKQKPETPDMRFSESDQLFVNNAGLVILWPFLGIFFERLDLLYEKRFKDEIAMHRACALLQYLVNRDPAPTEFLLPLNKIMCGMSIDTVYEHDNTISPSEENACEQLLEAAIEHASILKNMSVVGFQDTFLQRQGSLGSRDGAWLLRVERETYDVVLERFPWNIEWVKLPWMKLPLRVEW